MQELMQEIEKRPTQISGFNAIQLLKFIEPYLEKEKEQIINAYLKDRKGNIVKCLKSLDNSEDYYNKTYNL